MLLVVTKKRFHFILTASFAVSVEEVGPMIIMDMSRDIDVSSMSHRPRLSHFRPVQTKNRLADKKLNDSNVDAPLTLNFRCSTSAKFASCFLCCAVPPAPAPQNEHVVFAPHTDPRLGPTGINKNNCVRFLSFCLVSFCLMCLACGDVCAHMVW